MKSPLSPLFAALLLAACTTVPPTNVHQPMTVRPEYRPENAVPNGSIYQAGNSRTLFEDRRARYVGDIMTVQISEKTSAATDSKLNVARDGSIKVDTPKIQGLPGKSLTGMGLEASSNTSLDSKGNTAANNNFTGTITVTVIEVLSNGNLLVSGEKQVSIGQGTEYIRLSGIVNPYFIGKDNAIRSDKVADARIEYKESGVISEAQVMGWLTRFFMSVLPF